MLRQDRLFQLIHGLSPKEKATFTKIAQLNHKKRKRPDYEKLFQDILKQKEYNEELLLLSKENYVRNFSYNKNRLTDKILEVFTIMYAEQSPEMKLKHILSYLPILYRKQLWGEMTKKIQSAKKIAQKIETFHLLSELIEWEKKLYWNNPTSKNPQFLDKLIKEQEVCLLQLHNKLGYQDLRRKVDTLIRKDFMLKSKENRENFNTLLKDELMAENPTLLCRESRKIYYQLKAIYYRIHKDYHMSMEYMERVVELCEKHKELVKPKEHKDILCAYLTVCDVNKYYVAFPYVLKKLQKLLDEELEYPTFNTLYHLGLRYYLNVGKWDRAETMAVEIENKWEQFIPHIKLGRQLAYCYNLMILYWFIGKYDKAIYWLLQITLFEQTDKRQDIVLAARLLQLVLYYEKQNINFENKLDATRKTLKNNNQLGLFQQTVIQAFRKLYRQVYQKDRLAVIQNLAQQLEQIPKEEQALGFEEIQYWCKSKLSNIPLKEILSADQFKEPDMR